MKKDPARSRTARLPLTVILHVYNMEKDVDGLYRQIQDAVMERRHELVFVDDGSQDGSYDRLSAIARKNPAVRLVRMRTRFGESAALDAALEHSTGNRIIFISGRVRPDVSRLPRLLAALDSGQDFVIGWRHPRRDSRINRLISRIFNSMVSRMSKIRLHDINSGIFATRRQVLEKLTFYGDLFDFLPVLAAQQGYRVTEEKIGQLEGEFRISRYPGEYLQRLLDMITVFFLSRYAKKPIHFMGFLGTLFFLVGFAIEGYLLIYRVFQMGPIAGRPLLILGALLLVIGIQMISIGLIGEMIIFTHAGEIEEYNIEEVINGSAGTRDPRGAGPG
ncbi:glycosyltransferase [bacterium]|nr:glycosyltransferase [bacterium]